MSVMPRESLSESCEEELSRNFHIEGFEAAGGRCQRKLLEEVSESETLTENSPLDILSDSGDSLRPHLQQREPPAH